jgi:N6-adenosine-specific RNA methylase IME4
MTTDDIPAVLDRRPKTAKLPAATAKIDAASIAVMKRLDVLDATIQAAPSLKVVDDIANAAAGYQRQFKNVFAVSERAGEVWVGAEVKIGTELAKLPKAKPSGANQFKDRSRKGTDPATIKELGLTKKRAARALRLAAQPKGERAKWIKALKDAGKAITPASVLMAARQEMKRTKRHQVAAAVFSAEGPFDVVVIDPPWQVQKIDRDERPSQDAFDYPTMSLDEISAYWTQHVEPRTSPDCHLFCWTTQKFLPATLSLMEGWRFRYVLTMVWHKAGGFQPLDLPQYNCEFVVYARRGAPVFIDTKDFFCCFGGGRREHSRKPDEFYDLVRRVTGGSRVDVFSREAREGFAQAGNEIDKYQNDETPILGRAMTRPGVELIEIVRVPAE